MLLPTPRSGISCPECRAPSRVADTVRLSDSIERVRRCRCHGHLFHTTERPYRSDPPNGWGTNSATLNTRNLLDRIIRERIAEIGLRIEFKTIELIDEP